MSTPTEAALAQQTTGPGALVEKYRDDFATVLATHINPDQWIRLVTGYLRRNPAVAKVAVANPGSFMSAVLDCASKGLVIGDTYHLVVFGSEIQGIADYTGLIEMMYRAGAVASVKAELVYAGDTFRYDPGSMERPEHQAEWFGERGEIIGGYGYAVMANGATSRVVLMGKADFEKHRAVGRGSTNSNSPWVKWYGAMCLKTLVRELNKWVPTSAEYRDEVTRATIAAETVRTEHQLPAPFLDPTDADDEFTDAELVDDADGGDE